MNQIKFCSFIARSNSFILNINNFIYYAAILVTLIDT